jgi:hypothetical protein
VALFAGPEGFVVALEALEVNELLMVELVVELIGPAPR